MSRESRVESREPEPGSTNPALDLRFSTPDQVYALAFGLMLGLAILKFGNPIILDQKIEAPTSLAEAWTDPWPTHWANWLLAVLAAAGAWLAVAKKRRWTAGRWLLAPPLIWLCWQLVSAASSVDHALTATTLWDFAGCVACYLLGATVLGHERALRWLLAGVLAAFAVCLLVAYSQRFQLPRERQFLLDSQRLGWTNLTTGELARLRRSQFIISTNGAEVVNPIIIEKLGKARVFGTLVDPNALAGALLLLGPVALVLAVSGTQRFRPLTRAAVIAVTLFLMGAGFFGTGSKSGWLLALAIGGLWLLRLNWPARWKCVALASVAVLGLTVFAIRFHSYFSAGATSVGARFDYWRVAVRVALDHPLLGTGPGTFQRPYARLKLPDAEMARLAHNDYLEQFSDSGVIGGMCYAAWVGWVMIRLGRKLWQSRDFLVFAVFSGLLGGFAQSMSEFGLYIPAMAWTAFTLLGWLLAVAGNRFDKPAPAR